MFKNQEVVSLKLHKPCHEARECLVHHMFSLKLLLLGGTHEAKVKDMRQTITTRLNMRSVSLRDMLKQLSKAGNVIIAGVFKITFGKHHSPCHPRPKLLSVSRILCSSHEKQEQGPDQRYP